MHWVDPGKARTSPWEKGKFLYRWKETADSLRYVTDKVFLHSGY